MTTEHVSVPRELLAYLKVTRDEMQDFSDIGHLSPKISTLREWLKNVDAILSRATPSESDLAIHMDRDAWRAAMIGLCQGAMSDVGTPDKAADHLRKRLAKAKPSAPRAVTSEMVTAFQLAELEYGERMQRSGIVFDPALSVEAGLAAALESLTTSLPAARVPDANQSLEDRVEFALRDAGFDYDEASRIAMLAAALQAGEKEPGQ